MEGEIGYQANIRMILGNLRVDLSLDRFFDKADAVKTRSIWRGGRAWKALAEGIEIEHRCAVSATILFELPDQILFNPGVVHIASPMARYADTDWGQVDFVTPQRFGHQIHDKRLFGLSLNDNLDALHLNARSFYEWTNWSSRGLPPRTFFCQSSPRA